MVEDLEDLHTLAQPDRAVGDFGFRIDLQPVFLGELTDRLHDLFIVHEGALAYLVLEDDVFRDGHVFEKHEMLLNHADPAGHGVGGCVEMDFLPFDVYFPA